ncbi:PREDICTED: uncharacterized mitochondrial protein ymf1-like [Fragaria vesca subsp. vesca]
MSSPLARRLLQSKRLSSATVEKSPILLSFQSSSLTSNQWRKLKNLLFPGKTSFRPSFSPTGGESRFSAQLARSAGPTCISYFGEEASGKLELLPSWSNDQDLLLLYGQNGSSFVNHMDVAKVDDVDDMEASLFQFYLPSSYLCSSLGAETPSDNVKGQEC